MDHRRKRGSPFYLSSMLGSTIRVIRVVARMLTSTMPSISSAGVSSKLPKALAVMPTLFTVNGWLRKRLCAPILKVKDGSVLTKYTYGNAGQSAFDSGVPAYVVAQGVVNLAGARLNTVL